MITILQVKRVDRQAKKIGKVEVKAVNMCYVEAMDGCDKYGLNVHDNGKIEFFRNNEYTAPSGSGNIAYRAMMKHVTK